MLSEKDVGAVQEPSVQRIDATGKLIFPGLIDVHTHVREPGFEYKETIRTRPSRRSRRFHHDLCNANSRPVNDNQSSRVLF